jgi:hypothetical protein
MSGFQTPATTAVYALAGQPDTTLYDSFGFAVLVHSQLRPRHAAWQLILCGQP